MLIAFGMMIFAGSSCGHTAITAARFSALRSNHTALRAFLRRMPKGADLHVHLSGAVYAEDMIEWAIKLELCYRKQDFAIVKCGEGLESLASLLEPSTPEKQANFDRLVNAYSLRNFTPSSSGVASGHDQFFASFDKFGTLTGLTTGEMTAELLRLSAADTVQHTELMTSFLPGARRTELGLKIGRETDPARRLEILKANKLDEDVENAVKSLDSITKTVNDALGCETGKPQAGCKVTYRYIVQIVRNFDEATVFAQTAFAAALVRADPRVVGLNFVGPEDYRYARLDYRKHMAMIGFLAKKTDTQAEVPVALHAGELWIGVVPPDDLTFHIREAVETAGAKRIGHGVALAFEKGTAQLLAEMRKRKVAVEINLTSNDGILGVRGKDHPLMAYFGAHVPVALSTDDAGVNRSDLTNEYFRAARDYPLGYRALKQIARNSLDYSFLSGPEKDAQIKKFQQASGEFERAVASEHNLFGNLGALLAGLFR